MRYKSVTAVASSAVIALAMGSLAGCTAQPEGASIRVWSPYPEMYDIPLSAVASAYEEANPGTTVEVESSPYDGYTEALQTQFEAGTAPDVLLLEPPALTSFTARGYLADLTDALDSDVNGNPWRESFDGTALSSLVAGDGNEYAAPWANVNVLIDYRADIFDELGLSEPTNFAEELANDEEIDAAGIDPQWVGLSGDDASLWWRFTLMLNAGFRPLTEDINLLHADGWTYDPSDPNTVVGEAYTADEQYVAFVNGLTDPAESEVYREAIELLLQLQPYTGPTAGWSQVDGRAAFITGTVAQRSVVGSEAPALVSEAEEAGIEGFEVESFQIPPVTEEEWPALTAGPTNPLAAVRSAMAINAESADTDLAIDFAQFATSIEGQDILYSNAAGDDGTFLIGQASAVKGVTYPPEAGLNTEQPTLIPELSLFGFGMPPTYDTQDFDEYNTQFQQLWTGAIGVDEFLAQRSASNAAALERNLDVFADQIDQSFIDANTR